MPPRNPHPVHQTGICWPTTMHELEAGERFVVWAFRCWRGALSESRSGTPGPVSDEFGRQFGPALGRQALAEFAATVEALCRHVQGKVALHDRACPCLGSHEVCLLCMVAGCQQRNARLAHFTAGRQVGPDGVEPLLRAVVPFARRLLAAEVIMPERLAGPVAGGQSGEPSQRPTLH